jgi:ketosteroid isomerase-like protein
MLQENISLVKRFLEQYPEEVPWDMVGESAEVDDHDAPDQGVYRGHPGVARWLQDWGVAWSEWSSEPEQFIDAGDSVVVVVRVNAKRGGSDLELDRQDAQVYRFRDNKILRRDYYSSKAQALEPAGFSE